MAKTTIQELAEFGQSIWLDNINRALIETGELSKMIEQGLLGMTSNPTIFDKAVSLCNDYDEKIKEKALAGKSNFEIYDDLTIGDVQDAADIFRSVYERTNGLDGYISLEINPELANKTKESIAEGRRLSQKVNRPNVMFKVPSTDEGFAAVEELLAEGININVTLIFSLEQYVKTAQAFLRGMSRLSEKQGDLSKIQSVASVFVSRIDTAVDKLIEQRLTDEKDELVKNKLQALKGQSAVANSSLIYKKHLEIFSGEVFKQLRLKGANIQRLLWGSTSTKNPAYSDIKYITELIAKNTINTTPEKTFAAFLDHGTVKEALSSEAQEAVNTIESLRKFGIDINSVCKKLLADGVVAFVKSFESLLQTIETKTKILLRVLTQ